VRSLIRRFRALYVVPVLALIALAAWSLASPIGASPDDDFHLTSIWCASANPTANCTPGSDPTIRNVPVGLLKAACYLPDPRVSAACQNHVNFDPVVTEPTARGNFVGGYPPVYYAVMGLFVGPDIVASALTMRVVNIAIFVGLISVLFWLLPAARRPTLIWSWLVTTVPLGMFLIASNNPSSWAIVGVGCAWLSLFGYFESSGARRVGLGIVFAVSALIASGSRGDAAVYTALSIAVVAGLRFTPTRSFLRLAILPLVVLGVCVFFFVSAQQVLSGLNGFGGGGSPAAGGQPRDVVALLAFNLLNVPSLWAGVFGSWGLGWLEVGMPSIVALGSLACFLLAASVGFARLEWRKSVALATVGLALIAVPVVVLTRGGDLVGEEVQPRYLLPLIVLLAGLLLLDAGDRFVKFSRGQVILVTATLAVVQFVALHVTMRRYITGTGRQGFNLDAGVEWWWNLPISPMSVLIIGSAAYAALLVILARHVIAAVPPEQRPRMDSVIT